jgi:hypothetical protein
MAGSIRFSTTSSELNTTKERTMLFDWDDDKRKKTLIQRGIDFIDAVLI